MALLQERLRVRVQPAEHDKTARDLRKRRSRAVLPVVCRGYAEFSDRPKSGGGRADHLKSADEDQGQVSRLLACNVFYKARKEAVETKTVPAGSASGADH